MPLLATYQPAEDVRVSVWRDAETVDVYRTALPDDWMHNLPSHPARALHTLSARRALLELNPELRALPLLKDQYGKPKFGGETSAHFSLTHTDEHAAAVSSPVPCGIDLQARTENIVRLRSKFERPDERTYVDRHKDTVAALHVLWGAKESLFKLWGKRQIDWHEHLIVHEFQASPRGDYFTGEVRKDGQVIDVTFWHRWIDELCLVVAYESTVATLAKH